MKTHSKQLKPWKPRQEVDAFKIFLIVEFWLLLAGVGVCFINLWWGLGVIAVVLVLLMLAFAIGGF